MGDDRGHQRALAAVGQINGVVQIAVAHDGGDGAEGLCVVHAAGVVRVGAVEQHRRHKGAFFGIGAIDGEVFRIAKDALCFLADDRGLFQHVAFLAVRDQSTHAGGFQARVADLRFRQSGRQCFDHRVHLRLGRDDAADGGAFLARLGGHFAADFLDEEVKLRRAGLRVGAKDRGVEAVLLSHEADRVFQDHRVGAQFQRGAGGAGEADHVLHGQMVQHVAQAAGDQLQRAFGQDAAVQHQFHCQFRHIAAVGGGFHDGGNAGQQGGCQFLQHAPDREVEGVDMHRDAAQRGADVLAQEGAVAAELLYVAVEVDMAVRHLAAALGGEDEHGADAAVDVDHVVGLRGAGVERQVIERLLVLVQVAGERLQHPGAVVECQLAQVGAAHGAGVVEHSLHVELVIAGAGNHLAGDGAGDVAGTCARCDPLTRCKAGNL